MASRFSQPEVGRVVEVIRGRDSGLLAVVVGRDPARFVWIADGDKRRAEKPKRKNVLHVRCLAMVAEEIVQEMEKQGRITNARIRHVLKQAHMALGRSQE